MRFCEPKKMHPKSTYCLVILTFLSAYFGPTLVDGQQRQSAPSSVVEVQQQASTTKDQSPVTTTASSAELSALVADVVTTERATSSLDASATPFAPIASLQVEPATRAPQQAETGAVGVGGWIERILVEVENLNLNNRRVSAKSAASSSLQAGGSDTDDDDNSSNSTNSTSNNETNKIVLSSISQAPGEDDPLESTSTLGPDNATLLLQTEQQKASTQYSLSGGQPAGASVGWPLGQAQEAFDDDEQRLVDSNNVSAVLAPQATRPVLTITTVGPKQSVDCEQAYTHCALRKVCAPALRAYNDDCQDLINNRTSQCSAKCLKAMIALRSSEEGDDLVNCDCQGHEYCEHSKQRSQACRPQVEHAVDPKTIVPCSTASWICMADQLCSTALEYYYRNCQSLFSQGHCSMRCNNSLSILYRQPKASKLINCYCDGSEEFPCVKYKTYTERFCLNKPSAGGSQLDVAAQNEDDSNGDGSEDHDDSLNMTNDPEPSFGGSISSSSASSFAADADEEEYEDPKAADGGSGTGSTEDAQSEESLSAANLNGIQTAEDNWIPLMSGRFFTNLHQQQQRVAQQQQQQQQHKLNQNQHRQHSRKSQKTAKQKAKSNSSGSGGGGGHNHHETTKRNRYASRLHMLAATSSAIASNGPWTLGMLLVTVWMTVVVVVVDDIYSSHRLD